LLGPTGIGKTRLSLKLVQCIPDIEIISADSMQIYKYMDIGTDKLNYSILNKIKHHMIDIIAPDEYFDVSRYCQMATAVIHDINNRNKIPLMIGGTGLYISSMISPLFSGPGKDLKFRRILKKIGKRRGIDYLFKKLSNIDPDSAKKIHANDLQRIIRALEVYRLTGQTISSLRKNNAVENKNFTFTLFGLSRNRESIYRKINSRVDKMIERGLIEEVISLREMGYHAQLNAMQSLGYKQIYQFLNGECDKDFAINQIKIDTRHYAKRQMTWFKNKLKDVQWFNLDQQDDPFVISEIVKKMLKL